MQTNGIGPALRKREAFLCTDCIVHYEKNNMLMHMVPTAATHNVDSQAVGTAIEGTPVVLARASVLLGATVEIRLGSSVVLSAGFEGLTVLVLFSKFIGSSSIIGRILARRRCPCSFSRCQGFLTTSFVNVCSDAVHTVQLSTTTRMTTR